MKKIVAIVGSPRKNGNTSILVDAALEEAKTNGCEVEKIMLGDYKFTGCQGHDGCSSFAKCKVEDDFPKLLEKFQNADGTILATPVYYYNMTAQMKTFVDRNYFRYTHNIPLKSKCMGAIVVAGSSDIDTTIKALQRCIRVRGVKPEDWLLVTGYALGLGAVKNDQKLIGEARQLGKKMAETVNK